MIQFNRYLRPQGDVRLDAIERPADIERLAELCTKAGAVFEAEVLRDGNVSLTSRHILDKDERDLAGEVVQNGPDVPGAVDRLVQATAVRLFGTRS
jgi:hypothetical protein